MAVSGQIPLGRDLRRAREACCGCARGQTLNRESRIVKPSTSKSKTTSRSADGRRATPQLPEPPARRRFRAALLAWYRKHGRDLPWRRTDDPYHILVSEVMLQQTQVERVLPKYHEWLRKFPSLDALSRAPEEEVVRTWYPLGYNIRPRRLQSIARESVARHGGRLPDDEQTLRSFKGIGAYTAGAVLSFAFGRRAAILDTNVARVLFRVFVGKGDPKSHAMKKHLWAVSDALVPVKQVFDFNQALMDFGATLCTARKPKCLLCPMRASCAAYPFNPDSERAPL
jgi:A/G-specific adenine glycosylase